MEPDLSLLLCINRLCARNGWLKFQIWKEVGAKGTITDCLEAYLRLRKTVGLSYRVKNVSRSRIMSEVENEERLLRRYRIAIRVLGDFNYPASLTMIEDPPFLLYFRGQLSGSDRPAIAIVGTRRASSAALRQTFNLALDLNMNDCLVVSGMAYGIDRAAHEGALGSGGDTWAVLAGGLDRPSPYGHRKLASKILDMGGALIGEIAPGNFPARYAFHMRNRILSGLCRCSVIMQAPQKSGALITARFALSQNRDLFVASEGICGAMSAGTRDLEQQGAVVVENALDLMSELNLRAVQKKSYHAIAPPVSSDDLALMMNRELEGKLFRYMGGWFENRV